MSGRAAVQQPDRRAERRRGDEQVQAAADELHGPESAGGQVAEHEQRNGAGDISQAIYAATMAPMVLRSSSPASTASPNAQSRDAVKVRPSVLEVPNWSLELTWFSGP